MRQAGHVLIALAFWALLGALWLDLAEEGRATVPALRDTALELGLLAAVLAAATLLWVRHNVGIYRRKGPRLGRPDVPPATDADRLGRPIRWELDGGAEAAGAAQDLVVDVVGDVKTYRPAA